MRNNRFLLFLLGFGLLISLTHCGGTNSKELATCHLENESTHAICSVTFHHASSLHLPTKNHLRHFLRVHKLEAGESLTFEVPPFTYDVNITTCDGLVTGFYSTRIHTDAPATLVVTDEILFVPVR